MLRLRDFLLSSASLVASQVVTAGVGFLFWVLASRLFTQEAIGLASAVVSGLSLIGTLGAAGLGSMLIHQLPRTTEGGRLGLVSAALVASTALGTALGAAFVLVAPLLSPEFEPVAADPIALVAVAVGAGATAGSLVLDQALIGLLRSGLQLIRNVVAAIARVALLGVAAVVASGVAAAESTGLVAAWTASLVLSLVAIGLVVGRAALRGARDLRWDLLNERWGSSLRHHALNLALQIPGWAMPLIAIAVVSARVNAGFFFAWQLLGLATFSQIALNWMYFAAAAREPGSLSRWGWVTLRLSIVTAAVGAAVMWLAGPMLLAVLGPGYEEAGGAAVTILPLMLFPLALKAVYVTIHRVRDDATGALAIVGLGAGFEMAGAFIGALAGGLPGLCVGLLAGTVLEVIPMLPTIYGTIVRSPRRAAT